MDIRYTTYSNQFRSQQQNNRRNDNLEQQAQALFNYYFIDCHKKWERKSLYEFGNIICGKTPPKSNKGYFGGNIPFIKIPDMHNSVFVSLSEDSLSDNGDKSQIKKGIPPYSILVSCIATVGLVVMNTKYSHTNQQINSIIPKYENTRLYLYQKLKRMSEQLQQLARGGTATLNLNTGIFSRILIDAPDEETLTKFHLIMQPIFKKIEFLSYENQKLALFRETILPKLMSGELKINDLNS
jgi:type I restriction enzyme S subunit